MLITKISEGRKYDFSFYNVVIVKKSVKEIMPRPKKNRWIRNKPGISYFKPQGVPLSALEHMYLGFDELEAVRLADLENMSQEQGAEQMNISRATFGRVLAQARTKIADALINGKAIQIQGGQIIFHPQMGRFGPGRGRHRGGRGNFC